MDPQSTVAAALDHAHNVFYQRVKEEVLTEPCMIAEAFVLRDAPFVKLPSKYSHDIQETLRDPSKVEARMSEWAAEAVYEDLQDHLSPYEIRDVVHTYWQHRDVRRVTKDVCDFVVRQVKPLVKKQLREYLSQDVDVLYSEDFVRDALQEGNKVLWDGVLAWMNLTPRDRLTWETVHTYLTHILQHPFVQMLKEERLLSIDDIHHPLAKRIEGLDFEVERLKSCLLE